MVNTYRLVSYNGEREIVKELDDTVVKSQFVDLISDNKITRWKIVEKLD